MNPEKFASSERRLKLGFGTYGMKGVDIFEAASRLRRMGYGALEIAAAEGWPTAPDRLDASTRQRLRRHLEDLGFSPPVLLASLAPFKSGNALELERRSFDKICALARDLNFGSGAAIVTTTFGGEQPDWGTQRRYLRDRMLKWADAAAHWGVVLAVEPHIGGCFDRPEKARWLMEHSRHPALRLNFDFSHFHLQGLDLKSCLEMCAPFTVHLHIKDGFLRDGKPRFLLPGQGNLDLTAYMSAIAESGLTLPVTVEVSGMLWNDPAYDPWTAAERSFAALEHAQDLCRDIHSLTE